jgi:DNA-directed RNA polymerase III subunit RPC8
VTRRLITYTHNERERNPVLLSRASRILTTDDDDDDDGTMFVITTIVDTIRIPAHMLAMPTLAALHKEIDLKYPNRVLMDSGLVVGRYGDCLKITNGTCVPGDGGSHHECLFRLIIFRPFVDEVCIGKIVKSTVDGVQVSLGFFQDIFIPAYWMLRPSRYDEKLGLWVWTPDYDDEADNEDEDHDNAVKEDEATAEALDGTRVPSVVKTEAESAIKTEENVSSIKKEDSDKEAEKEGDRFEMDIGAEIRFKVKSIQFTQVTNTAKGVQATTTTMAHSHSFPKENEEKPSSSSDQPIRRRSSLSVELSDIGNMPASMQIIASICEDGLGLTSWWTSSGNDDEQDDDDDEELTEE